MDKYRNPGQGFAQNQHHTHPIRRNYSNVSGPRISPRAVRTTTCSTTTTCLFSNPLFKMSGGDVDGIILLTPGCAYVLLVFNFAGHTKKDCFNNIKNWGYNNV